jgi:hypothetical protein
MKTILFVALLVFAQVLMAQPADAEKEAIKQVIQTAYVEGLQNEGDTLKINSGIHSGFNLLGVGEQGNLWALSIAQWKNNIQKKHLKGEFPRKPGEEVSIKFLFIDITGNAAVAKIEFYVGTQLTFVDYISLYKFPEGWKLVSKIFYKF